MSVFSPYQKADNWDASVRHCGEISSHHIPGFMSHDFVGWKQKSHPHRPQAVVRCLLNVESGRLGDTRSAKLNKLVTSVLRTVQGPSGAFLPCVVIEVCCTSHPCP